MNQTPEHLWVEDIKGPILLLARDHLAAWRGVEPGVDWPGDVGAVPGVLGIAPIGDGIALMLHDDYAGAYTTWEPLAAGGGVLVGDVAYRGDAAVDAIGAVVESAWRRADRTFATRGGAVLFDGFWPGAAYEETGYAIELAAGAYAIDTASIVASGKVVARYVRLLPTR